MRRSVRTIALSLLALLLLLLPWIVDKYSLQLIIYAITYSMLALGFSLCWKVRLIRVDLAGYWGIGAYATGMLMSKAGWSFWPTIAVGGLIAAVIAWGIGKLTIPRGGLVFFTFAMLVGLVIQQLVAALKFFGGWAGIESMPPPAIGSFIFSDKTEYYFLGLFLLSINYVTYYLLYDSRIGRAWTAIGSGVGFAKSIGVDVVKYRLSAVILSSFFSAVSGSYLASYQMYIIPDSFGFYRSIMIQMFSLVGGLNNFLAGPVIGATIMTFVPEYLKVTAEIEPILTAVLMILVIMFMPTGILGLISKCWRSSIVIRVRSKLKIGST